MHQARKCDRAHGDMHGVTAHEGHGGLTWLVLEFQLDFLLLELLVLVLVVLRTRTWPENRWALCSYRKAQACTMIA
jgi:hypothetical protein